MNSFWYKPIQSMHCKEALQEVWATMQKTTFQMYSDTCGQQWKASLVDSPTVNAHVMPKIMILIATDLIELPNALHQYKMFENKS